MRNYFRLTYYLYDMSKKAHLNATDLQRYQNQRLKKLVKYTYQNVPFYRQKFDERGLKPEDIATTKDLKKLPIIKKQDINNNPEAISKEYNTSNLHVLTTSGSTGKPLKIYINNIEDEYRKAKHLMANISCGQKPRDKYVAVTAPSHFKQVPKFLRTINIYDRTFISVFDGIEKQTEMLDRIKPKILAGYASSLLLIAEEFNRRKQKSFNPKFILSGAELLADSARKKIENTFESPVYDQYAIMEFDRIAWQCRERQQYHMDSYALITEFVDKNGEEVSEGEPGEIICTSLFNYAMPFIRYSVGDIGIPSNDSCECGIKLPLMKVIEGRKDSLLVLPNGRILSPRMFTVAMNMSKMIEHIDQFRLIQKKNDRFELHIKTKDEKVNSDIMKNELISHFEKMLNLKKGEVAFEVEFQDNIDLDKTGKFKAVISELN